MDTLLELIAAKVALACELCAVAVLVVGAVQAIVSLGLAARHWNDLLVKKRIWASFASWIVLALEFALAADIVRTAIAPSWTQIGQLAAIAAIRTALNLFLERDIEAFLKLAPGAAGKAG
jgi:uncharacterized membrane protein